MRIWAGCAIVLFSASCAAARPEGVPAPRPAAAPAGPAAPTADSAVKSQSPATPSSPSQTAALRDSLARDSASLAAASRDSALDAAMLDRIAAAEPPATTELPAPPPEGESAALRSMFDIDVANFEDHGRVRFWINFFSGPAKERMAIWLKRMPRYEPTFRALLVSRGLPGDLAYLPLIESGYSSTAVSRSRAVGMWQFMRPTGKFYGLTIDSWVDERRDVPKATDAAVRYLADLTKRFGSSYLAAAAYNGGPGRIGRGLRRMGTAEESEEDEAAVEDSLAADDGDMAFFQLANTRYIHQETKDYVPKLIAAAMIAKQPERYGFPVPMGGPVELDSLVLSDATGFDVIAKLSGVPVAELREINPSYLRDLTPPKRTSVVRLPAGLGGSTQAELDALPASERLGSFPHRARSGETLTSLGKKYGVALGAMRSANPEYARKAPRKGEVVVIPGEARLKGWVAENRRVNTTEVLTGGTRHRVKRGETLGGIARRYRVTVSQLRGWNGLRSNTIRAGQLLRLRPGTPRTAPTRVSAVAGARVHVVRAGDTLSSIARRYRTTIQALRSVNHLPASRILAGQRLKIPS
jgi:membrane-bound lytic murein transglycosylase D